MENVNEIKEVTVESEVVEVIETTGKFNKVVGFGRKHGKKIIAGIALVAVGAIGYSLGKRAGESDLDELETIDTSENYGFGDDDTEL